MSRIFADQIQKPSGTAFSLPVGNGANNQFIQTDGQGNLSFENPVIYQPGESWLVAPETAYNVGTVSTHTDRNQIYSTGEWTSSSSWTTYNNSTIHTDNHAIQFWNMLLGDGYSNASATTERMQGGDSEFEMSRRVQFASGNRVGYRRDVLHWDNSTNYSGHTFRCLPIRNTNSGSVSVSVSALVSNYWESGYEGSCLASFVPNAGKYSAVTAVTGTNGTPDRTLTKSIEIAITGTSAAMQLNGALLDCIAVYKASVVGETLDFEGTFPDLNLGTCALTVEDEFTARSIVITGNYYKRWL